MKVEINMKIFIFHIIPDRLNLVWMCSPGLFFFCWGAGFEFLRYFQLLKVQVLTIGVLGLLKCVLDKISSTYLSQTPITQHLGGNYLIFIICIFNLYIVAGPVLYCTTTNSRVLGPLELCQRRAAGRPPWRGLSGWSCREPSCSAKTCWSRSTWWSVDSTTISVYQDWEIGFGLWYPQDSDS